MFHRRLPVSGTLLAILVLCGELFGLMDNAQGADLFRSWFTPTVVPTNFTGNVRFEAEITGSPSSVAFRYSSVDRPMFDDGSNGNLIAGDGVWTCVFTANEIISKYTTNTVFRPFIGYCIPTNSGQFNIFAEIWTAQIGLAGIRTNSPPTSQETDYAVNFVATKSQLTNFNANYWASNFYKLHGDYFDLLNFVQVAGVGGNRYHVQVKNNVHGIGGSQFTNSASYGSAGRLQGYTLFPLSSLFDGASPGFIHETGHQWINYLSATPYAVGMFHWPKGDIAINVMGYSNPANGEGLQFPWTFSTNGNGGYITGAGIATNLSTFNPMELYLMGMATSNEVPNYFVLTNQNVDPTSGQIFSSNEVSVVTISNVIAAQGARLPASTNSQRVFVCATIVLSEQLLDPYAMSLYDYFARRAEGKQTVTYLNGLAGPATGNPWYVATGGRSLLYSRIVNESTPLTITQQTNRVRIDFNAKPGIRYQPQRSFTLLNWSNIAPQILVSMTNPVLDVATNILQSESQQGATIPNAFYRINVTY